MGPLGTPKLMKIDKILKGHVQKSWDVFFSRKKNPAGGHLDHKKLVNHNIIIRQLSKIKIPRSKGIFRLIFDHID